MHAHPTLFLAVSLLALPAWSRHATETPAQLLQCAALIDDTARLECYDRLAAAAGTGVQGQVLPPQQAGNLQEGAEDAEVPPQAASIGEASHTPTGSLLAAQWELDAANDRGKYNLRPHYENYLIAAYSSSPNSAPYRPFRVLAPEAGNLSHAELAFQLSFKLKFAERPLNLPADLWFGYTQRSFWQADNQEASSPFRATDYQPEVMAVFPTDLNLLGLRMRFVNIGFLHASNGQTSTLSRSWNRAYAQVGLERGNFTLLARTWKRFSEEAAEDDNPDITDYMGHGDLIARYRRGGHEFSLLTRYNFKTEKGGAQLGWSFPISSRRAKLKGYLQLFTGYGHTLIDYNHAQNVIGLGILISD